MNWLLPANGEIYNHAQAFQKWGFIDWRQGDRKYEIKDIIYIYCTRPYQRVMYKTVIDKINLSSTEIVDDKEFWINISEYEKALNGKFVKLRLLEQVDRDKLSLKHLLEHGLKAAPQSSIRINDELKEYIDKYMNDNYHENVFPDSAETGTCREGAKTTVEVNKYERSSVARKKCVEYHGCFCHVCDLDFEKLYGEFGRGFIHVHHCRPLSETVEEYLIDYKKDLIPVCPNCHAMLHRKISGKNLSVDDLKCFLQSNE